ncbi:hypothetical protein BJ165DRAFT_1496034 [Panaeolus papilionaceus]|nr:hypothetical protein BJ165DRAFT_1496034 [Panaeolus papilionaceus]
MYGQRYPSLERPERVGHEDDEDDESKELGYLGSTPTKASTQPYGPGGVLPPGRFKWPDLSINSLRQSIRRPGGAGQQNPPHDFRRHIVDLSAHQQQHEDGMGYAYHYQNPYDPPREDSSGGSGRGRPSGGAGPREGFRHWGVSLQETYYDEAVVFPYTDYPENEWEWMKENGSLPMKGKVVEGDTFRPSCAGIVSRNHSEASAYPPSRAMSKRSAGTVKDLGLEDGGKGRRLLEEVKKEKKWMDSIRGILTGGASGGVGEGGTSDREALVGRGDEYAYEEEEMTPRALNRSATMRTKPSRDDPETSPFVNGRGHGAVSGYGEDDEHHKNPVSTSNRYTSPTPKAGSHQHQRLTAPSKRRAHKRGDSDAYVADTEMVEIEGQRTPTQALFRGGKLDEGAMASFGAAMHDLDGGDSLPETPDRHPRLSNVRHSYAPLRDKEEEEAKRDRYTPKPARTRKSRSRDGGASPSRYARSRSGTTSSESVPMTVRRVESSGDDHGQSSTPQKSPTSMAKEVLPRSPPQITSPPLENQMFFATTPNKAIPQTPIKGHSRSSRKARSTNYMPPSSPSMRKPPSLSSRSGTPGRKTPTTSRSSAANSKPVPPPLIPPAGSSSTAHNRSDITFTSRLTGESTGTAARVQVAQNLALDKLGRIVESSWNVREQAIGEEGMRALSPTAFGRKVQG